ncbi:MAG TPA: DUF2062 domain-containing protein [Gammaproteobacteria bacterium]|nr:DUF2062 domain-containing protein [Gammaproteobacteria bacterium]
MPRKFLKRHMPDHRQIREHKHLQVFGGLLHDPNLWHLNRRSAAGAFAVGLFCAFVPIPLQMILAAGVAILFRVNLPISVALVWITNPLTMAPIYYFAYKLGAWVLHQPAQQFLAVPTFEQVLTGLNAVWIPFLLGCFILSSVSAAIGYFTIRGLWRLYVVRQWRRKKLHRKGR